MSRKQMRDSGIVGGLATLAIRAKTYLTEAKQEDKLPPSINGKTPGVGKKINSEKKPTGKKKGCEDPAPKTKNTEGAVENKNNVRQSMSYKKCHKTEKKATQKSASAAETTKENGKEENGESDVVQSNIDLNKTSYISTSCEQPIENQSSQSTEGDGANDNSKQCALKRRSKILVKLDEKSDMGKLADEIVPQLTSMQKNLLGLLFFNELSENIVEDLVTQQLNMMPNHQMAQTLNTLNKELQETVLNTLVDRVSRGEAVGLASLASQTLDNQSQAQLLHRTSHNTMEVLLTMVEYGGKSLRRNLLHSLIAEEDDDVMDSLIYEHLIQSGSIDNEVARRQPSCADEEFTSCDELSEEQDGRSL